MAFLTSAQYGKANINILKVVRLKNGVQIPFSLNVTVLLEGDFSRSYTHADNTNIVATDTQKQTVYILARKYPVWPPELFATTVADHFINTYPHLTGATVEIVVSGWDRINLSAPPPPPQKPKLAAPADSDEDANEWLKPHPHAFTGTTAPENRAVTVIVRGANRTVTSIDISTHMRDLKLLKTTGSAFHSFHRDQYTRLPETQDRILATKVDATWEWDTCTSLDQVIDWAGSLLEMESISGTGTGTGTTNLFQTAYTAIRNITVDTFATEESPSVQNTMYIMAERALKAVPDIAKISYTLPNIHNFDIDLSWYDKLNVEDGEAGENVQVYAPQADPNGLIMCTVSRLDVAKPE